MTKVKLCLRGFFFPSLLSFLLAEYCGAFLSRLSVFFLVTSRTKSIIDI